MTNQTIPSPSLLRKFLRYEPTTGKLFWKPRQRDCFMTLRSYSIFHSRFSGKEAFKTEMGGYFTGEIMGKAMLAHRAIWAMHHDAWPEHVIDHIDGNPKNNRITNLRHTTQMNNSRNRRGNKSSTSKFTGVSFSKQQGKWHAQICGGNTNPKKSRTKHLGFFDCQIQAAKAYDAAAKENYGDFARLNFPD